MERNKSEDENCSISYRKISQKSKKILDREADEAEKYCKEKGINTAIILDSYLVHTSGLVKLKLKQW